MLQELILREAEERDLPEIIRLLSEDELESSREFLSNPLLKSYQVAFQEIMEDKHQMLCVLEYRDHIIGTCHLTVIPYLSFKGSRRLNIEDFHVDKRVQGQGIGTWMMQKAISIGREKRCKIIQLTTNKSRSNAITFCKDLGFKATHEGMKLYL